jgi:Tol biopolymer transport system component
MFFKVGEHGLDSTSTRIFLVDVRTRQVSTLPASEGLYSSRWSPDGRNVVAITWDGRKLMLCDFGTPKWSELATGSIGWPSWSLDGKYVSYVDFGPTGLAVKRVRIENRKIERVADLEQIRGLNAGRFWSYHGVAPDGSPIFLRNTGIHEIYALDVDFP